MMKKQLLVLLAGGMMLASPALAQGGHNNHNLPSRNKPQVVQPMRPMSGGGMMMQTAGPAQILSLRDSLGLSADQVRRLEALQQQVRDAHGQHAATAMRVHHEAQALLQADRPDFAAYEAKLKEMANHHVAGMVAAARVSVSARDVLTPAQQTRLRALSAAGANAHGQMMQHPGMGSDHMQQSGSSHSHSH